MAYKQDGEDIGDLPLGYNLADKANYSDWCEYIAELEIIDADIESIKARALLIAHVRALKLNHKVPEKIQQEPERPRFFKTKMLEKLASCETLDDYINLAR